MTPERLLSLLDFLDELPTEKSSLVREFLPSFDRDVRLHLRDELIREVASRWFPSRSTRKQAQTIESNLNRHQLVAPRLNDSEPRHSLCRILDLNGGRSISWQQISNILLCARSPQNN